MTEEASDERIQPALDAFLSHDVAALQAAIDRDPEIVNLRWGENTLIEWATQPPHGIAPEILDCLITNHARLDRALNLAGCWNLADLCRQLLAAGANPSARADADITPLESAAMHGSTESADVLVEHGLHRSSLWLAAASGRLDLVRDWVREDGKLLSDPDEHRPDWAKVGRSEAEPPSEDPDEILGEALVFGAANNRRKVVEYLLDAGVDIDSRPYRNTTGLHLAVQFHKPAMVDYLLERGASTAIEDDDHHGTANGWATACNDGSAEAQLIVTKLESVAD